MFSNETHTAHDLAHFAARGIDPTTREPRKQPVPCVWCPRGAAPTMNRSGLCDRHDSLIVDALADLDDRGVLGPGIESRLTPRG